MASYHVQIKMTLSAAGPVLVSSGADNQTKPEMEDTVFLMGKSDGRDTYVIPGSSLKGVISHYLDLPETAYLFGYVNKQDPYKREKNSRKSKIAVSDFYADMDTIETDIRYSTALGSISQSAKSTSLNNMQPVIKGDFHGNLRMKDVSADEICKILNAIAAIDRFEICIGGKTSRGFGRMRVSDFQMTASNGYDKQTLKPLICGEYDSFVTAKTDFSAKIKKEEVPQT